MGSVPQATAGYSARVSTPIEMPLPTRRATRKLAEALAAVLVPGDVLLLEGELGAGKTFLVRQLARALGVPAAVPVTSPTFTLLQELSGRVPILHGDLYRLGDEGEVSELGIVERLEYSVVVLEWASRFVSVLGGDALRVEISWRDGTYRVAVIDATGPRSSRQLDTLRAGSKRGA
jgi:tRNA threonylcarbamoyladenosine biosynthesis protein TsaE